MNSLPNKRLGVIGGMGPLATSIFFQRIVENTIANKDQDHIDVVIMNHATMPDRTEAILNNEKDRFLKAIQADIHVLEHADVANIAIPCNTSHYFYEHIAEMTNINIINMVSSTAKHVAEYMDVTGKVAVLGTSGTIRSNVYKKALVKLGLQNVELSSEMEAALMDIIYNIKRDNNYVPIHFNDLVDKLIHEENCSSIVLACTELSSIDLMPSLQRYCVDALDILVKESILLSNKQLKREFLKKLFIL